MNIPFSLFDATTEDNCTCGGNGPGESDCVACIIYHEVHARMTLANEASTPDEIEGANDALRRIRQRESAKQPRTAADELSDIMRPLGPRVANKEKDQ